MSIENELKVIPYEEIKPEEMLELLKNKGYTINGQLKVSRQEDTYYDDKEGTLNKSGCSFRIRRKGNGAVVTCKIPMESDTEYKKRVEMEVQIPEKYIKADGTISIDDAINILYEKYPGVKLPENLSLAVKVINYRNKVNVQAKDGSIIEVAFDDLRIEDKEGNRYKMKNEIEAENLSGNPENLNDIYEVMEKKYDVQKNSLSKYSRAVKEMNEQRDNMSLDEVTVCAMFSDILNTVEFEQLKYKGQMIHNYKIPMPEKLNLDNFKDPNYLINRISEVRRTKNYKIGQVNHLEDMFLCFFSDMDYRDLEYKLVNFLDKNYYGEDKPITNRMLHSQQVMLITALISKSKEITEEEKNPVLCTISALLHDIGHVPGAHPTEEVLGNLDGFFSHEINGRNVIERIITRDEEQIVKSIKEYYEGLGKQYSDEKIKEYIQKNKIQIKKSIEAHSRTNSEKRGDGTVVQLPREADKICYCVSDIVDIIKKYGQEEGSVEFYPESWKNETIKKLGKNYAEREKIISEKIDIIEGLIKTNDFGKIATSIADTIKEDIKDGKIYYDVDQDTWDILDEMIKYIKRLRSQGKIDNRRPMLKVASTYFIVRKFNEALKECDNNVEQAWEKTLQNVTRSNDLDILQCINELKETFKNSPNPSEEMKKAFEKNGILDTSLIEQLDNSNRQIKMQPKGRFQMLDVQTCLGTNYEISAPENIRDTYFNSNEGISLCLREKRGTLEKSIIVKRNRNRNVLQLEREKFVTTDFNGASLDELIEKFNSQHPEFHLKTPTKDEVKCQIVTIRNTSVNEKGVVVRRDISKVVSNNMIIGDLPETIEVECNKRNEIKKVKEQIAEFLNTQNIREEEVFTRETKEEQAMRLMEKNEKDPMGR